MKSQAGQYAHRLLQAQEEVAILQKQLEAHSPYPALPGAGSEDTAMLQAKIERLQDKNKQLRASLNQAQQLPSARGCCSN